MERGRDWKRATAKRVGSTGQVWRRPTCRTKCHTLALRWLYLQVASLPLFAVFLSPPIVQRPPCGSSAGCCQRHASCQRRRLRRASCVAATPS